MTPAPRRWLQGRWLAAAANIASTFGFKDRALDRYLQLFQLEPARADIAATCAALLVELDRAPAAAQLLEWFVAVHPNHPDCWFNLGFIDERLGLWSAAEACFERALRLRPTHDRAWYGLGMVRIRQGRLDAAIAAFLENTRLQPLSPYGWYQLAMAHQETGNATEAGRVCEHLRTFEPRFALTLQRDLAALAAVDTTTSGPSGAPVMSAPS